MASRDPKDLYLPLRERWYWMRDEWKRRYPDAPQPFLTATYRDQNEQLDLFEEGKSKARPGQSLHNFKPALAFDVAFDPIPEDGVGNQLTYLFPWYQKWGELAEEIGLVWGGRWAHLVDGPHVQMPMSWEDAEMGEIPSLLPLPDDSEWMVVLMYDGQEVQKMGFSATHDIVTRVEPTSRRVWIDVKSEDDNV